LGPREILRAVRDKQRVPPRLELLVVIVVLGILAAIVVFALSSVTTNAAVAACKANASTVNSVISAYNRETGGSPVVTADRLASGSTPFLKTFRSNPSYAISIVSGVETVAAPSTATPVPYGLESECDAAGSASASISSTSTAVAPTTTTTTTPLSNNVAAARRWQNYSYLGGTTSMTITINVARTIGVTYNSEFNSFPRGNATSGGFVRYTCSLKSGHTIPANYSGGEVGGQWGSSGTTRMNSGDPRSVTSTSGEVTSTRTGTF
jgi:general secretion pathway protein G